MNLTIPEKFLLLAQHPAKGRLIISGIQLQYGIIGALLLQMSVEERINIENDLLILKSGKGKPDPMIAEIELLIRNSKKQRKTRYWVNKLARKSRRYKKATLEKLSSARIIRIEPRKFLGIIPYKKVYLVNSRLRNDLIKQLKNSLISKHELTNDKVVLLGLIEAAKMHKIFSSDKHELKRIKKALKESIKENKIAATVDKTIKEVQAAIISTIIVSSVVTSSGSH